MHLSQFIHQAEALNAHLKQECKAITITITITTVCLKYFQRSPSSSWIQWNIQKRMLALSVSFIARLKHKHNNLSVGSHPFPNPITITISISITFAITNRYANCPCWSPSWCPPIPWSIDWISERVSRVSRARYISPSPSLSPSPSPSPSPSLSALFRRVRYLIGTASQWCGTQSPSEAACLMCASAAELDWYMVGLFHDTHCTTNKHTFRVVSLPIYIYVCVCGYHMLENARVYNPSRWSLQ